MKYLFYTLLFWLPCMLIACGGSDDTPGGDDNPPVVVPPDEEPTDPRLLYNGIRLPEQWPPVRSSSSELEKGMSPFYWVRKPPALPVEVSRKKALALSNERSELLTTRYQ